MRLFRDPLFRLLAVNLGVGIAAAMLMLAGLVALNPGGLRELMLADTSGGVALALLGAGFVITFGSVAMGSAIMAIGRSGIGGGKPTRGNVHSNGHWLLNSRYARIVMLRLAWYQAGGCTIF